MLGGASNRTTPSVRRQERGLVDAVGHPVEVPLDASDVVALRVRGRPERRRGDRGVVGQALAVWLWSRERSSLLLEAVPWTRSGGRSPRPGQLDAPDLAEDRGEVLEGPLLADPPVVRDPVDVDGVPCSGPSGRRHPEQIARVASPSRRGAARPGRRSRSRPGRRLDVGQGADEAAQNRDDGVDARDGPEPPPCHAMSAVKYSRASSPCAGEDLGPRTRAQPPRVWIVVVTRSSSSSFHVRRMSTAIVRRAPSAIRIPEFRSSRPQWHAERRRGCPRRGGKEVTPGAAAGPGTRASGP